MDELKIVICALFNIKGLMYQKLKRFNLNDIDVCSRFHFSNLSDLNIVAAELLASAIDGQDEGTSRRVL